MVGISLVYDRFAEPPLNDYVPLIVVYDKPDASPDHREEESEGESRG